MGLQKYLYIEGSKKNDERTKYQEGNQKETT
mgnify:FL=1